MSSSDVSQPLTRQDGISTAPDSASALHFSDSEDEDSAEPAGEHPGDYSHYSQRMEELLDEEEDGSRFHGSESGGTDEEEAFVYTGVDASDVSLTYREQLRNVLGQDHEEDSGDEAYEVENSLLVDESHDPISTLIDDEPLRRHNYQEEVLTDLSPSASSFGPLTPPSRIGSPALLSSPKLARPFLHPTVSRLRSYTPQAASRLSQNQSAATSHSHLFEGASPSPSRFSSMSRASSVSNLRVASSNGHVDTHHGKFFTQREVFRWSELHIVSKEVYTKKSQEVSNLLGAAPFGSPTVLAANGMICIGLEDGRICVYDFKQTLKAVCGTEAMGLTTGPVTSLALSHDHTCVVSGHATGHIQLYDLKKPHTPIRSVPPTTMAVVATGRKEGHLYGSRVVSVGFISGRHTALVSADENGLAFYHSLGKMLFVEASDILRILGQYPDPSLSAPHSASALPSPASNGFSTLPSRRKGRYTILSMAPLPLGTSPHATDAYDIVALLTPTKLVVVGLRPTPKTWFKCPREFEEGQLLKSKMKGTLAWFPSVSLSSGTDGEATDPILAYTWGNSLRLIRVVESRFKQRIRSAKTGKTNEIEIGTVVFENIGRWAGDETIIALQWLNPNQLTFITPSTMGVYDIHLSMSIEKTNFDGLSLMSPTLNQTANGSIPYSDSVLDVAHSLRVYKGKVFMLARDRLLVGTLLTWADRILVLVESGDFLSAIELCRTYYTGEAPGNRNGLPNDPNLRKEIVGEKLRSLMDASVRYTFSEDRMTDGTHVTPDNRGVDRTSLFEGLVSTCCRSSVALNDFEFLFEDLFQRYDDCGISGIYLKQLEPFILDNEIRYVPPRITQRLVAQHEADGQPEYVERIIWHMDPSCLDLNQTIHLCQKLHLYDALIYIYTRALQDYVSPLVELLGLIRRIQGYRKSRMEALEEMGFASDLDPSLESLLINAYKIYPYLANVLSGLSYPSEEQLPEEEAFQAKKELYTFLFFGRSSVWPPGNDGKLILTAEEDGGLEPTYPYARQLLRFDSESFLHCLDIAFEDAFLNDELQSVNRLIVVRILLEIVAGGELTQEDVTFVNIFIARNVPKYPQFLQIAPTALHNILTGLAEDPDTGTRDDRQLAAEYLLSVYNPHDIETVVALFEQAGFYRILRTWYRQDHRWANLFSTYIKDDQLLPSELFENVHQVLKISSRHNKGSLPTSVIESLAESLPHLLRTSITDTAVLIDSHRPELHETVLEMLKTEFEDDDQAAFVYLRQLLAPTPDEDQPFLAQTKGQRSDLSSVLRHQFIDLQSRLHPENVTNVLQHMDPESLDWQEVVEVCEQNGAWDAVVWSLNWRDEPEAALKKAESFHRQITRRIIGSLSNGSPVSRELDLFKALGFTGRDVCLQRSQSMSTSEVPLEDLWFALLSSQIHSVQTVSASGLDPSLYQFEHTLADLRSMVQTTFTALVSITSTQAVSFPRLFKRLVNSTPVSTGTHYNEFRIILGGMLESYRFDADMLAITQNLIDRDLFHTLSKLAKEKDRGWALSLGTCNVCRKPLLGDVSQHSLDSSVGVSIAQIIISRTGTGSHSSCLPSSDMHL